MGGSVRDSVLRSAPEGLRLIQQHVLPECRVGDSVVFVFVCLCVFLFSCFFSSSLQQEVMYVESRKKRSMDSESWEFCGRPSDDKLETVSGTVYSLNQQGDLYGEFLE